MTTQEALAQYAKELNIGQHKRTCPFCSHSRSKNKNEPCLSLAVYGDRMVYNCHHCKMDGIVPFEEGSKVQVHQIEKQRMKSVAKKPLTEQALDWLQTRGISKETAKAAKLFSVKHWISSEQKEVDCIGFPYIENKQERGAKIRSLGTKGFSCTSPLRTFFNVDSVDENDITIICEGEMDALSFMECGMSSIVSVPNGAVAKVNSNAIDPKDDKTFSFLWDSKHILDNAMKIVIACDSDGPGQAMAEELARRIGKDRCWKIDYPEDCKDANEVLLKHGKDVLEKIALKSRPWPVSGVYDADHFRDKVIDLYENGFGSGQSTGYGNVDELYKIVTGQLTVVTGIPSSGKSEFIDQIMMNQALLYGLKFAVCSFENEPHLHMSKMIAKYVGKPFSEGDMPRVTPEERDEALDFIQEHFTFLHHTSDKLDTLDDILERLRIAVLRHGIRGAVIDPYNYIAKPSNVNETDWISDLLTKVRVFAQSNGIHIWFVAHPTKLQKENGKLPVPKGYDISGSAAWFAKADVGMTVHRPDAETSPISQIHIWKCRFAWVGRQGQTDLVFDKVTSRYKEVGFAERYVRDADADEDCPF